MEGWAAVTHHGWFDFLAKKSNWEEVNFWTPSDHYAFRGTPGAPFLFKLKSPRNAIGGFGFFSRFDKLPEWLAWDCFKEGNGAATFDDMQSRLGDIRERNHMMELRYCYRGTNPLHRDNVGLRLAMQRQVPLVYCHGVLSGRYVVEWPVFVVGDSPGELMFTVNMDEHRFALLGGEDANESETDGRRRYVTRLVQQRLHQEAFRQRVLAAYHAHCAVCHLRHEELLEAAHILPDSHPQGHPVVPNGLALSVQAVEPGRGGAAALGFSTDGQRRATSAVAIVTAFSGGTTSLAVAFRSHARTGTARAASVGARAGRIVS